MPCARARGSGEGGATGGCIGAGMGGGMGGDPGCVKGGDIGGDAGGDAGGGIEVPGRTALGPVPGQVWPGTMVVAGMRLMTGLRGSCGLRQQVFAAGQHAVAQFDRVER